MRRILSFALGPIASGLIGVFLLPIIAWYFSAEDIGKMAILQLTISFSILLFSMGLDQAFVREYHESKNKKQLFKISLVPGLLIILIVSFFFLIIDPTRISNYLFLEKSTELTIIIILAVFFSFCFRFFSLIFRMEEKGIEYSLSQIAQKFFYITAIVSIVLQKDRYGFFDLLMCYLFSVTVTVLAVILRCKEYFTGVFLESVNGNKMKEMLHYGFPLIFGGVASWALYSMDRILLQHLSNVKEVGIYSVAMSFASAIGIFTSVFNTLWSPSVYKWSINRNPFEKVNEASNIVQIAALTCFVGMAGIAWFIPLFLPEEYSSIDDIIILLTLAPIFYTISETTSIGIGLKKRTVFSLWSSMIAALINFIGNIYLIPKYGATGAAISTSFAMFIFLILRSEFSSFLWHRIGGIKLYLNSSLCLTSAVLLPKINNHENHYRFLILITVLSIGLIMYKKTITTLTQYVYKYIKDSSIKF